MRNFFLLLVVLVMSALTVRASEAIDAPSGGKSALVSQPHVTAELIPETSLVVSGKPFGVILHLHSDPGWHTYWINPGDAGLATTIKWTLPPGFTAGPIQWPTPEKHTMGSFMTYGYEGDVYLPTTITPAKSMGAGVSKIEIKARASWLVCREECIPGKGDFSMALHFAGEQAASGPPSFSNDKLFAAARARLPVANTRWMVKGAYGPGPGAVAESLWTQFDNKPDVAPGVVGHVYFFPEQNNVLSATEDHVTLPAPDQKLAEFQLILPLQQNGEKPAEVSGVLVSDEPLIGNATSIYIPAFRTDAKDLSMGSAALANPSAQQAETGSVAVTSGNSDHGLQPPLETEAPPWLITILLFAFVGGLILNLMPCVLPVLSLKVFSLIRHAGDDARGAWKQGVAFTAGVVVSFWVLAGLLLALRAAGQQLGWGFQMQSPGFVLALIFLFFLLALNLLGVFELGSSLAGLDVKATGQLGGLASSFGNGALATLAATPCTAPFMGSSLGFAAQQPAPVALLIFTFLALGMAMPYLLLTAFPGALRFVPKPGAWMEGFKQFMGFLLLATVIFLIYVFGALTGSEQVPVLLFILLLTGVAAWIYGRWGAAPTFFSIVAMALLYGAAQVGVFSGELGPVSAIHFPLSFRGTKTKVAADDAWQPWSAAAVDRALAENRPVFVDFTAAWCLSCKVNERVALGTDAVQKAFKDKNVVLLKADWTQADPLISDTLRKYHRDGVPLYLLYSPKNKDAPQVLPEVLTPGIVLSALDGL